MRRDTQSPSGFGRAFVAGLVALLEVSAASAQTLGGPPTEAGLQVEPAETERARAEFRRGAELSRAARWDEARDAFARSSALRSHPVTTYNLAFCERALGHPAVATVLFEQALIESAAGASGRLPEPLVGLATDYRDETRARLARLSVHLQGAEQLSIDGIPISRVEREGAIVFVAGAGPPAALGTEATIAVWVDPGQRVLVASRANHVDRVVSRRFHAAERAELGFAWDSIPSLAPAPPVVLPVAPAPQRESRPWAYVALGSGLAGLVASGLAGFAAYRKHEYLENECGAAGRCSSRYRGDVDALGRYADIATVSFVLGAVGVASGVTLLALPSARGASPASATRLLLRPAPRAGFVLLAGDLD